MATIKTTVKVQELRIDDYIWPDSPGSKLRRVSLVYAPPTHGSIYAVLTYDGLQRSWPKDTRLLIRREQQEKKAQTPQARRETLVSLGGAILKLMKSSELPLSRPQLVDLLAASYPKLTFDKKRALSVSTALLRLIKRGRVKETTLDDGPRLFALAAELPPPKPPSYEHMLLSVLDSESCTAATLSQRISLRFGLKKPNLRTINYVLSDMHAVGKAERPLRGHYSQSLFREQA